MRQYTKSERLNHLKERFRSGAQLTIPRIMSDYEVDRRTVNRDLNELEAYGLVFEEDVSDGTHKIWRVPVTKRQFLVEYKFDELMSLFLGRRLFDFGKGTVLEKTLERLYGKIEKRLNKEEDRMRAEKLALKLFQVNEGPKILPEESIEILDEVLKALVKEHKLDLTYTNAEGVQHEIIVHPYTLVAHKRGLYVVGQVEQWDRISVLALERMDDMIGLVKEPFTYPDEFTPEGFFQDAFFIAPGTPERVELRFTRESEPFIGMRNFHESQRFIRKRDGLYLKMKVPVNFELINWISSFGPNVQALSPPKLVEEIKNSLEKALAQYD